ncbi:MaoC family dehydratase N-terminal domain-containing protein [Nocardioides sp. ChNu-153]|uniref:FAS1-like dehydratase domain-containing protein n=1 Tax=unclassified Nocardioides TaxID=2615069 RepID=UPI002404C5F6|nr:MULTISPECIES: MaoC family dehydratase N-terminal domain-containing protein [unclassified Nocardioides]MDF9714550.1 MaoC family dehydratase N-terminal domain-containing protein [Nocardioides sp. ChNu-99]MDN7119917.1 MaoC family dehydratase N-terminal domain-containing protein [Nocardioides sp. ChNu-153]
MSLDSTLVGRTFPATSPYRVSEERVAEFAAASGTPYTPGGQVPATFPIVLAFAAMNDFLDEVGVDLSRIVHGEQKFAYARPLVVGDVLTTALTVASLRQIGGNDIIGTRSDVTDADGVAVCSTSAVLVHRGGAA